MADDCIDYDIIMFMSFFFTVIGAYISTRHSQFVRILSRYGDPFEKMILIVM